jgi:hypothetical protein
MMDRIAIMQPYFFPYIGYYQLVASVDQFVFCDDVDYITQGWISRNKILIHGKAKYVTIPCKKASQNKILLEVKHALTDKKRKKLTRKIQMSYGKAPFFDAVFAIFKRVLNSDSETMADLAIKSIRETSRYLKLDTLFNRSSETYENNGFDMSDRIINICKTEKKGNYINSIGGKKLYDKGYFKGNGINLFFLESQNVEYEQFNNDYVPCLSIIDVMMFNSPEKIRNDFLQFYKLI